MSLQPTKEMIEMQKLYRFTELEFLEFNRVIPYDHNPDTVFSPELFNLLYSIGPQIYGMFEILTTSFLLRPRKKDFPSYHKVLNAKKLLSSQRVILRDNQRELRPFVTKSEVKKHPWWAVYNGSKHAMPYGIFDVKLKIVLNALGGLHFTSYS